MLALDIVSGWDSVAVDLGGQIRTAVFVFEVEGGVVFVEPSYPDAWNSQPADHFVPGEISQDGTAYRVGSARFYDPDIEGIDPPPGHDEAVLEYLQELKTPLRDERAIVGAQVSR